MSEKKSDSFTEAQLLEMPFLKPGIYQLFGHKEHVRSKITKLEMPQFIQRLKDLPNQ